MKAVQLQAERDKLFSEKQDRMMAIVENHQADLLRVTSRLDMQTEVKMDDFFPIQSDSDMQRFLDKGDGQFHLKRESLENMLYCNLTKSLKLKRPFEAALLSTLFSRDYISSHRWPGPRYDLENVAFETIVHFQ